MTADMAVDTGILIKWVIQESDSRLAEDVATSVLAVGGTLVALDLALVEAANVLGTLVRRGVLPETEAKRLFGLLAGRPLLVVPAQQLLAAALDVAIRYKIAVYDACFIALTVDRGIPGITADGPLYRAVRVDFPDIVLLRNWTPPIAPAPLTPPP